MDVLIALVLLRAAEGQTALLYSWGSNANGQMGNGVTGPSRFAPGVVPLAQPAVAFASGGAHSGALTADGKLLLWGYNYFGQIGDGGVGFRPSPTVVPLAASVTSFTLGDSNSAAITSDGLLHVWGYNMYGQVGDRTFSNQRQSPTLISLGEPVASVALGGFHSGARTSGGHLYMWGRNHHGQVGMGTANLHSFTSAPILVAIGGEGVAALALGGTHSGAVSAAGHLYMWGWNARGQIGDNTATDRTSPTLVSVGGETVAAVALGADHSAALTTGGHLYMWGWNDHGQLGDGSLATRSVPTLICVNNLRVTKITMGHSHSAAQGTDGRLYMWGLNADGELGDGTTVDRLVPAPLVLAGQAIPSVAAGGAQSGALVFPTTTATKSPRRTPSRAASRSRSRSPSRGASRSRSVSRRPPSQSPRVPIVLLEAGPPQGAPVDVVSGTHDVGYELYALFVLVPVIMLLGIAVLWKRCRHNRPSSHDLLVVDCPAPAPDGPSPSPKVGRIGSCPAIDLMAGPTHPGGGPAVAP